MKTLDINPDKMSEDDLSVTDSLQYLFHRPREPLFLSKDGVIFIAPFNYLNDRHKHLAYTAQIRSRFTSDRQRIHVKNIPIPDISLAASLDLNANFTVFNIYHQNCASQLVEIFLKMADTNSFLSACVYCREHVNPFLFIYAASVAMLLRDDVKGIPFPTHVQSFPELYLNGSIFRGIKDAASVAVDLRVPIQVPHQRNGSISPFGRDVEKRLTYWREDVGVNLRYWNWYMFNPTQGRKEYVENFRRGEYFLYMHQQILARYNFERLCNKLNRVERMMNLESSIPEGYASNLFNLVLNKRWPKRKPHSLLQNINRPKDCLAVTKNDIERWETRLYEAVHGVVRFKDVRHNENITARAKLDIIGNMIEFNDFHVNQNYYGPLRTTVLMMLGYVHDPDGKCGGSYGNICDPATSMRDPAFYRWHATMDVIAQEQKSKLSHHTFDTLDYETDEGKIRITLVNVLTDGCVRLNEFYTFWQHSDIDLSKGLDFNPNGPLHARVTHLQHAPFTYRIQIHNPGKRLRSTIRIYLSPKFDEKGRPFNFEQQRSLFIEQDQFDVYLRNGLNVIKRPSRLSTVTMSRQDIFPPDEAVSANTFRGRNFIGWPEYMLIPKGTEAGFPCQLFVMVTNAEYDSTDDGTIFSEDLWWSEHRYEDGRSFGFPFDRPAPHFQTLSQFLTPNMFVTDTCINFMPKP